MSDGPQRLNLIERVIARNPAKRDNNNGANGVNNDPAITTTKTIVVREDGAAHGKEPTLERVSPSRISDLPNGAIRANFAQFRASKIVTPENVSSATSNEFRAVKRKLLPLAREAESGVLKRNRIMITSALPGEGKTFVAMNLAISLATERNLQVLLIDTDVVRPFVPQFFEGPTELGLTDLLTGRCSNASELIHPCVDIPNLSVMFSGKHEDNSPELFASNKMTELCQELSSQGPDRILIFDAPPALASAEPTALAMQMHHILMVVAAEQPSRTEIEEAISRISACPNIHFLFNKSPQWRQTANSKYSYYYRREMAPDLGQTKSTQNIGS